ncbi:MAG: hypothetical protein ACRCWR_01805 [Saezia sp.]
MKINICNFLDVATRLPKAETDVLFDVYMRCASLTEVNLTDKKGSSMLVDIAGGFLWKHDKESVELCFDHVINSHINIKHGDDSRCKTAFIPKSEETDVFFGCMQALETCVEYKNLYEKCIKSYENITRKTGHASYGLWTALISYGAGLQRSQAPCLMALSSVLRQTRREGGA